MGMVGGGAHDGAVPLAQIGLRRAPNLERPPLSRFQIWKGRTAIFCEIDDLTCPVIDQRHACTQRLCELRQAYKRARRGRRRGCRAPTSGARPVRRGATAGGGAPFVLVGSCVAARYDRQR